MNKEKIKNELKQLIEDMLQGNKVTLNEEQLTGITLANFIIQKEDIIKKATETILNDAGEEQKIEKIYFDCETHKQYLTLIKAFSKCINFKNTPNIDISKIELLNYYGNEDEQKLKELIGIIHLLRNSIAHGKYEIEDGIIKINNLGRLECEIPLKYIKYFNGVARKHHTNSGDDIRIINMFDQLQASPNYTNLLMTAIYSYSLLVFADIDENNNSCSYSNLNLKDVIIVHNMMNFIEYWKQVQSPVKSSKDMLERKKETYENCRIEEGKSRIDADAKNSINNKTAGKYNSLKIAIGPKIRNPLLHGNCMIDLDGNFILYDKKSNIDNKIHSALQISPIGLFELTKGISERNEIDSDEMAIIFLGKNLLLDAEKLLYPCKEYDDLDEIIKTIELLISQGNKPHSREKASNILDIIRYLINLLLTERVIQILCDEILYSMVDEDPNIPNTLEYMENMEEDYIYNYMISNPKKTAPYALLILKTAEETILLALEFYITAFLKSNIADIDENFISTLLDEFRHYDKFKELLNQYEEMDGFETPMNDDETLEQIVVQNIRMFKKL